MLPGIYCVVSHLQKGLMLNICLVFIHEIIIGDYPYILSVNLIRNLFT